ncbi:protein tyrosine phosphatase family protein [Aquincola sp. S2]|uniref:Protein tyrosine phosphatase family protein n=1 Tax=Pseudaquabacterium terrae TaxID=2732868 RepID=A0ABX2EP12_9BURK|nr:protein tyrosine phosphatase family protein [Aquabacterium terrae]NRF70392.1 protein tyrosine phosphatase family protein [Aquabacterium terrae]
MIQCLLAALRLVLLLTPLGAALPASAAPIDAPNVVEISPKLTTSGQPTRESLAGLAALGYEAVIYLAPPTVSDAVRDEHLIVGRQGLLFVNLPIDFDKPTARDADTFAALLRALGERKVLVHCQVNMRASSMVFLYRAIHAKDDPRSAYEAVSRVWSPNRAWRQLIREQLRQHRVEFEPL